MARLEFQEKAGKLLDADAVVLMHELSHIMLGHELATASRTADGHFLNGNYDEAQEREADWLGGTLLLPRPALLWMRLML